MSIIIFLIILAVLIFVHELGHFLAAKKSGIRVDEFAIGFPPKLFAKKWRGTLYTINSIPFGGFVKIFGEDPHNEFINEEDKKVSFYYKPKWIQAGVLVAGVTFNIIFAWLLISLGFFVGTTTNLPHNTTGEFKDARLIVTEIMKDSPASKSSIKPGDTIVSISNEKETITQELYPEKFSKIVSESKNQITVNIKTEKGEEKVIKLTPIQNDVVGRKIIGVSMEWIGTLKLGPIDSLVRGGEGTYYLLKATTIGLSKFLYDTITFKSDFSQVTGPVGIAGVVKEASQLGWRYIVQITAIISINLAVINLVPFPALDGGRLLFVLIESIIRKPINQKFVRWSNLIGFAFLMLLMIIVTSKDILKIL